MKKRVLLAASSLLVLGGSALAADLPVLEAPPPVVAPAIPLWTGFYAGAQIGYGFSDNDNNGSCFNVSDPEFGVFFDCSDAGFGRGGGGDDDGFFLGAHVGYDYQINNWVFGGVADVNWIFNDDDDDDRGSFDFDEIPGFGPGPTVSFSGGGDDNNWYGTLRGRVGWAAGRFLVYGTGGLAFGEVGGGGGGSNINALFTDDAEAQNLGYDSLADLVATEGRCATTGTDDDVRCRIGGGGGGDDVSFGWTLGAGVDWLVTDNFSVGLEYLFVRLDSDDNNGRAFTFEDGTTIRANGGSDDNQDFHTIALKGSWRF